MYSSCAAKSTNSQSGRFKQVSDILKYNLVFYSHSDCQPFRNFYLYIVPFVRFILYLSINERSQRCATEVMEFFLLLGSCQSSSVMTILTNILCYTISSSIMRHNTVAGTWLFLQGRIVCPAPNPHIGAAHYT